MMNKEDLKKDLETLGFMVSEANRNIIASRRNYHVVGEELWTDNNELIIRSKKYGFRLEPRRHNILFVPVISVL